MALGVGKLLKKACVSPVAARNVLHCTTVMTNICIELIAAMVGRIATKGFWDVLEISHGRMPRLYDLTCSRPLPMVQLYLHREMDEQVDK
jgi:N-methylhydantoinase A/oxoprolinase/acetone carboxylase beta subunit